MAMQLFDFTAIFKDSCNICNAVVTYVKKLD